MQLRDMIVFVEKYIVLFKNHFCWILITPNLNSSEESKILSMGPEQMFF